METPSSPVDASPAPRRRRVMRLAVAVGIVLIVLGATGAVWLRAQSGPPKITWSQPEVLEFLQPSEERKITVTFRSDQNITDAQLWLTPSLLDVVVSVSPSTFKKIDAKKDVKVTVTLKAGVVSQLKFDGAAHLRSAAAGSSGTYANPLPLTVLVHRDKVPADPGPANDLTLVGLDADGDGVRDDLQRWIVLTALTSRDVETALAKIARIQQQFLLQHNEEVENILQIDARRERAQGCLYYLFSNPGPDVRLTTRHLPQLEQAFDLNNELTARLLNTRQRTGAYLAADSKLSGRLFTAPPVTASSCE